jgi:hypothetical protein
LSWFENFPFRQEFLNYDLFMIGIPGSFFSSQDSDIGLSELHHN